MTELILYSQQLLINPRFFDKQDFGWETSGSWTINAGSMTATAVASTLFQSGILMQGFEYTMRLTITGRTAGTLTVKSKILSGVVTHATLSSNGVHEVTFTAEGIDILLTASSTFDGTISNTSVFKTPEITKLDTTQDVNIPFNFQIEDSFNLQTRKASFSKTFTLPGTHVNNQALNHLYRGNTDSAFIPTKKARCIVKNSGITVFYGYLLVMDIDKNINGNDHDIQYMCNLITETLGIFEALGDKTIADLDFSDYDHNFTLENVFATWPISIAASPMVHGSTYVRVNGSFATNQTIQYTAPGLSSIGSASFGGFTRVELTFGSNHSFAVGDSIYIDSDNNMLSGTHIVLSVPTSAKIIISMLFSKLSSTSETTTTITKRRWDAFGYFYPLMDNGQFTKTITNGAGLIQSNLYHCVLDGGIFDNVAVDPFDGTPLSGDLTGETFRVDAGAVAGTFIPNLSAPISSGPLISGQTYYIASWGSGDNFANIGGPTKSLGGVDYPNGHFNGYKFTATGTTPTTWTNGTTVIWEQIYFGPETILEQVILKDEGGKLRNKNNMANHWLLGDFIPHIYIREIWNKMFEMINYYYDCSVMDTDLFRRMTMQMSQKFNVADNTAYPIPVGNTNVVTMNDWLPNMKLKDFFISILNMFNLVIINDADQNNLIHLISRNDFYSGTIHSIESDSKLKMKTSIDLVPNRINFGHSPTDDFYNTDYLSDFGLGVYNYGDYILNNRNEINLSETKVETSFVPTVAAGGLTGIYDVYNSGYGQQKVFSVSYSADLQGNNVNRKEAYRIFIIGFRGTDYPWTFESYNGGTLNGLNAGDPVVTIGIAGGSVSNAGWQYPTAHHFDTLYDAAPYHDLNFNQPTGVYFTHSFNSAAWIKRALYRQYWHKHINETISKNSKVISGRIKLSIGDISQLDFTDSYYYHGLQMRISRVNDWNVNGDGMCNVEFILRV